MSIEVQFKLQQGDFLLDAQLKVPSQGVTAIFGASGAGKTTLLRAIAGLQKIPNGLLKVDKQIWQDEHRFVEPHKRRIGYVFQEASLFSHLDVLGNLQYGAKRSANKNGSLQQAIELLDIGSLLTRQVSTLSGGERQRVAIARAIAGNPQLLLMDEPLVALDEARKQEILPVLEDLTRSLGLPILYVSHSMEEVALLADYMVLMECGKVLAARPIAELLTEMQLPLAHSADAEAIIEATVAEHDDEYQLSYLGFAGGRFTVERKPLRIGEKVRIRVAARDISITLQAQSDTSILNRFVATVEEFKPDNSPYVVVRLSLNGVPILSRVTRKSVAQLNLQVGQEVFVQIKSAAVLS